MNKNEIELLEKYIDGTLIDSDLETLQQLLAESSDARASLRSLATIEFGLQDMACGEGQHPETNGVAKAERLRGVLIGRWILAVAATVLLILGLFELLLHREAGAAKIARISGIGGSVIWTGDGGRVSGDLNVGTGLTGGTIQGTTPNSWVELEFVDGTTVTIAGDSRLVFSDFGQKELHLLAGKFSADVEPQPAGKPMLVHTRSALLKVVGTQFSVQTDISSTALDVNEGKVNVQRLSDGQTVDVPANHRVVAATGRDLELELIPQSVNEWKSRLDLGPDNTFGKWSPGTAGQKAKLSLIPYLYTTPQGERMSLHTASMQISGGDNPPVILKTDSRIRVRGHVDSPLDAGFGVIVRHPQGGFGGSFLVLVPKFMFKSDEEFEFVIDAVDLVLDPTLASMKDELVETPIDVVVEMFWCGTISDASGLGIFDVEFLPPESSRKP